MFVDELERFAAATRDPRCAAIAERIAVPLRVSVAGRRGVGASTVARALTLGGVDVTSSADADLDVRVVADAVTPEDLAATSRPVLLVLTKADLIATTAPAQHPDGPTAAARARCAQLSARAGLPVQPMVGLLAVAALNDAAWDALMDGQSLVPALDTFGTRQAVAAVRRGASRAEVTALLRDLSGIDAVVAGIDALGAPLRYRRVRDAVAELESMAATDPAIAEFLVSDDAVVAQMAAAIDAVESVGAQVERGDSAHAHLHRAQHWQRRRHGPADIDRVCGADIVRGSLRLWSQAGGSV